MDDGLPAEVVDFIRSNDFATATTKAIQSDLRKFVRWFEQVNEEEFTPPRVAVRDLADFRDSLRASGQATATVNRCLVSIRRFFSHLVTKGDLPSNPAQSVRELRRMPSAPRGLGRGEVRQLLRTLELRGSTRDAALVSLMLDAGLRVGEVAALNLDDIVLRPKSGWVVVRNGKGRKERIVPLSRQCRESIRLYLSNRPPVASRAFAIGQRGRLTADGIRTMCNKLARESGVAFTPHVLRHAFAKRFLEHSGNSLSALQAVLGHESLASSQTYTRLAPEDIDVEELRYA